MKVFKKLSLAIASLLLLLSTGASINSASANSQTNKLPHYMRNMWYGKMSEDGLKSIKLYGSPYINDGYSYLHINHITRYGHKYDLDVHDADPIEVWYSRGHLNGLESGTSYIHLYAHHKRHHNQPHYYDSELDDRKYSKGHFKRTNNRRLLKRSGFHLDSFWHTLTPTIYSNYPPYSKKAYIPKWIKIRNPRGGTLTWTNNKTNIDYSFDGHNTWECVDGTVAYN